MIIKNNDRSSRKLFIFIYRSFFRDKLRAFDYLGNRYSYIECVWATELMDFIDKIRIDNIKCLR